MKTFAERNAFIEMDFYGREFWQGMQSRSDAMLNKLHDGATFGGGLMLPADSGRVFCKARNEESLLRKLATSIAAYSTDFDLTTVDGEEPAAWLEERDEIPVQDFVGAFQKHRISRCKLATILRVHEDLCSDAQFDLKGYLIRRLAKDFARAEDAAFLTGTGVNMPVGILNSTGGAEIGVTTAAITYDDVIRLFFSVKPEYRDHGVWVMNDATALVLRTMKDKNGNYLWNQANDTILGKPVKISNAMPDIGSGSKPIVFGDFSYYWIMDREPVSIRLLRELYAAYQQTGFYAKEYLDGKLLRSEAIKVLQIEA